jgi:hypothetical protein
MVDYLLVLCNIARFVEEFKNDTLQTFFKDSVKAEKNYFFYPRYSYYWQILQDIANVCDVLEIKKLQANKTRILVILANLRTYQLPEYKPAFEQCVDELKTYSQEAENEAKEKVNLLDEDEFLRLNEALNCYVKELNYSAIVMSVSAVESRLYSLMVSKNPSEEAKLEKLTLKELIREYVENKERYGSIVLKKHLPLLDYCNVYRVFSAHPKKESHKG